MCFLLVSYVIEKGHVRICCGTNSHIQRNSEQYGQLIDFKRFSNFHFAITGDNCGHIFRYVEAADFQNTSDANRTYSYDCQLKG